MFRSIAGWLWRVAVLLALVWIGWELDGLREELAPEIEESANADRNDVQAGLDEIRDNLTVLTDKVDALLIAIARMK
jgi:hypothetical protein